MHRFTICYDNYERHIDIENFKFLIGTNFKEKFKIFETIRAGFNKVVNSDYAIEKSLKHKLLFDEKPIDSRMWKYFEVTPFFDIENDLKMGAKSLTSKYLESFSNELEQNEIFGTLQILINSLNEEFFDNETKINIGEKVFSLRLSEITRTTIVKEIFSQIVSDECECNSADISYEESVLLQLKMIETIASKNKDKIIFVYCNLPYITNNIKVAITGMKYDGLFVLVDTTSIRNIDIAHVAVLSKHYADFSDVERLNDLLMDFPFHILIEDLLFKCQNAISTGLFDKNENVVVEIFPWEIYS